MEKKKVSKEINVPSAQSTLNFQPSKQPVESSEKPHPPYGDQDRVANIFQACISLLELTQLGEVRLHRGVLNPNQRINHQHIFTERKGALAQAKDNFRKQFQSYREMAELSEIATVESWAAHTQDFTDSITM